MFTEVTADELTLLVQQYCCIYFESLKQLTYGAGKRAPNETAIAANEAAAKTSVAVVVAVAA